MLLICVLSLLSSSGMTMASDFSPSPEDSEVCLYSASESSTSVQPLLGKKHIYGAFDDIAMKRFDGKRKKQNLYQKKIQNLLIDVSTNATSPCVYSSLVGATQLYNNVELKYMPSHDAQSQVITPKSLTDTGMITFLDEKQRMRADRIFSYSNYLSLVLLLATPPLLDMIYCDCNNGVLEEKNVDHTYVNKVHVNILMNFVTTISINFITRLYLFCT